MDLDLRRLRLFVAAAEELSISRAAERLYMAQPALSRQIVALERDLGVQLLIRSPQGISLTPAGRALLAEGREALESADGLQRRMRLLGRGRTRLAIGSMPGMSLAGVIRRLRDEVPEVSVELVQTTWRTQTDVVRDGRVDLSVVRLPVVAPDLDVITLYSEPCVVAIAAGDRLAAQERVALDELASRRLLQDSDAFPQWRAAAARRGSPALDFAAPVYGAAAELFEDIAQGEGIVLMAESAARFYSHPGVVYRYVDGHDPIEVGLAVDRAELSPAVEAAIRVARHALVPVS